MSKATDNFIDYMNKVQYHNFLEKLRRSGVVNMFGAGVYLEKVFGLSKAKAREVLTEWMETYNPDDYE